jgi:hypothetical protein
VEPELQALAATAAVTIVGAMAGDAWKTAKQAVAHLCGRGRAAVVEDVTAELEHDRRRLVAARTTADAEAEEAVQAYWADRLARLLAIRPDIAADLDALVHRLGPAGTLPASAAAPSHHFNVHARGRAQVNVSGGDMRIGR